jgi:hypothetical protein
LSCQNFVLPSFFGFSSSPANFCVAGKVAEAGHDVLDVQDKDEDEDEMPAAERQLLALTMLNMLKEMPRLETLEITIDLSGVEPTMVDRLSEERYSLPAVRRLVVSAKWARIHQILPRRPRPKARYPGLQ